MAHAPTRSPLWAATAVMLMVAACDPNAGKRVIVPSAVDADTRGAVLPALSSDSRLSDADVVRLDSTTQRVLDNAPAGVVARWWNEETGIGGTITVVARTEHDQIACRDYIQTAEVPGAVLRTRGVACLQGGNNWRVVR